MRPFRDRRPGAPVHRGPAAFALLPTSSADQRLLIATATAAAATLAFLAVRNQVNAEALRLAHAGFSPRFGGAAWVRHTTGGGLAVIRSEPLAWRPQMAALGFITAGLMAFAKTCDWVRHSARICRFLGVIGLVGLIAGAGSLFRPRPETLALLPQPGTIRSSRAPDRAIPIRNIAGVVVEIPHWSTRNRGYRVAVDLRDGRSLAVFSTPDARTARGLTALLSAALDRAR